MVKLDNFAENIIQCLKKLIVYILQTNKQTNTLHTCTIYFLNMSNADESDILTFQLFGKTNWSSSILKGYNFLYIFAIKMNHCVLSFKDLKMNSFPTRQARSIPITVYPLVFYLLLLPSIHIKLTNTGEFMNAHEKYYNWVLTE